MPESMPEPPDGSIVLISPPDRSWTMYFDRHDKAAHEYWAGRYDEEKWTHNRWWSVRIEDDPCTWAEVIENVEDGATVQRLRTDGQVRAELLDGAEEYLRSGRLYGPERAAVAQEIADRIAPEVTS